MRAPRGCLLGSLSLPAIGVALVPKVACPACWPAYAGVLSALGIGFVPTSSYLLPLTVVFLVLAVAPLALRARRGGRGGPFVLGVAAAATIVIGGFHLDSEVATYAGVALLVAAWLWHEIPRRIVPIPACSACAPGTGGVHAQSALEES